MFLFNNFNYRKITDNRLAQWTILMTSFCISLSVLLRHDPSRREDQGRIGTALEDECVTSSDNAQTALGIYFKDMMDCLLGTPFV